MKIKFSFAIKSYKFSTDSNVEKIMNIIFIMVLSSAIVRVLSLRHQNIKQQNTYQTCYEYKLCLQIEKQIFPFKQKKYKLNKYIISKYLYVFSYKGHTFAVGK